MVDDKTCADEDEEGEENPQTAGRRTKEEWFSYKNTNRVRDEKRALLECVPEERYGLEEKEDECVSEWGCGEKPEFFLFSVNPMKNKLEAWEEEGDAGDPEELVGGE